MTYDYRVVNVEDNGEFLTFADVELLLDGHVVATEEFTGSSEFAGGEHAAAQAASYGRAWVETHTYTLEERLGAYGLEYEREQIERW